MYIILHWCLRMANLLTELTDWLTYSLERITIILLLFWYQKLETLFDFPQAYTLGLKVRWCKRNLLPMLLLLKFNYLRFWFPGGSNYAIIIQVVICKMDFVITSCEYSDDVSSSSFSFGAGDHQFPSATAVMSHGWQLTMIQYNAHTSRKALDLFRE